MERTRSVLKSIAVAVLVYVAHEVLGIMGVMFLHARDQLPENSIGFLFQEGLVYAFATYGTLAASAWFSNLRLRVLVFTFLLLVLIVNLALVFINIVIPHEHENGMITAVLSSAAAVVGAAIAAFVY